MAEYELRRCSTGPERIGDYARLLSAVFPETKRFSPAYLYWQYAENPDGQVVGYDALSGPELAAHYVTIPVRARIRGSNVSGLLSLNTATHPRHQGRGLFTRLASATYEAAKGEGYRFVIGVANQNSTPGFLRKLGFSLISPLHAVVGFGRPVSSGEPEFERLWSQQAQAWRLRDPSARYAVQGTEVFAQSGVRGIRMLASTRPFVGGATAGVGEKRIGGVLTAWIGVKPSYAWRGISLPVPKALRPSPLNLIFLDLDDVGVPSAAKTLFEALDFDAY